MLLKDSFTVDAPLDRVWAMLEDIPRLSQCMPGVEAVEAAEPDRYRGVLKVKVGPIAAVFNGQVRITERTPMKHLTAEVEGQDKSSASLVKATFTGMLAPSEGGTIFNYEMDIALRGRLAQFGLAVVQGVAKKMTASFAECLQAMIASEPISRNSPTAH